MGKLRLPSEKVLAYWGDYDQGTVRRHYMKWRQYHGLPERCDNQECAFHDSQLVWNGKPLGLILDHRSGFRRDNTPQNLRLLCPNCNSQLATQGGRNKGAIRNESEGGYQERRGGSENARVFAPSLRAEAKMGIPSVKAEPSD
jgi:hypothetical protein